MMTLGFDKSGDKTSASLADGRGNPVRRRLLSADAGERGLRQSEAVFAHVRALRKIDTRTCKLHFGQPEFKASKAVWNALLGAERMVAHGTAA